MSKPSPRHATPSKARRGLASAGVMSLALAGGAFAMAGAGSASAATATGEYNCKVSDLGLAFKTPWQVTLSADLPASVAPGAAIPAPTIKAHIVTGSDSADLLRNQEIVSGTSDASYTVAGQKRTAALEVTGLPYTVPATGGITTDASGTGQAETAPSTPMTVPVVAGDFTAKLTMKSGFVANLACTPANGTGITIGSIKVADSTPTPTTSTPAPTTSTPAPTTSTPAPTTSTPAPTTSTPAPTTSTPAPTTSTPAPTTSTPAPTTSTPAPTTSTPAPTSSTPMPPNPGHDHGKGDHKPGHDKGHHGKGDHKPGHDGDHKPGHDHGTPGMPTPTASSTAAPAPTQAPSSTEGPKVDTDYVSSGTANTAGVALAAAGVLALGGAAFAGRRSN